MAFTAVGDVCLALSSSADEEHLTQAYGVFAAEARDVNPDYAPKTISTDGWFATRNAFRNLFAAISTVHCFLHGFLKIRDRGRKARELHDRVWEVYRAVSGNAIFTPYGKCKFTPLKPTGGQDVEENVTLHSNEKFGRKPHG